MFKLLIAGFVSTVCFISVGCMGGAAYLLTGGIATVSVDSQDVDFFLPVPTRLADLAMGMADVATAADPHFDSDELRREIRAELDQAEIDIDPGEVAREMLDMVADLPNGNLVEVSSPDGYVLVSKRLGRFMVRVDSPDARVRVSMPARSAKRIGDKALRIAGL